MGLYLSPLPSRKAAHPQGDTQHHLQVWFMLQDELRGMAVHSSMLAWRLSWTEEPGGTTKSRARLK